MKLEFDKTYFIHKVVIYYRFYTNWYLPDDWCVKSEANFKKCVDNDNDVDVSVYQGEEAKKSCGTLHLTYGLEQSDQIYTLLCNAEGDTVKLSKTTHGNVAVYEVAITGKSMFTLNNLITSQTQINYCNIPNNSIDYCKIPCFKFLSLFSISCSL